MKFFYLTKTILLSILILFLILSPYLDMNFQGMAMTPLERQRAIEADRAELAKLERQIAQYETNINKTEKEKRTLRNQISILRNRIRKLDAQIRQGNIRVRNLEIQIRNTEVSIQETSLKIKESREKLATILRVFNKNAEQPIVEVFLNGETISDFFNNLFALETLNNENKRILKRIQGHKVFLDEQKLQVEDERHKTENVVATQLLQKQEQAEARKKQEDFLKMTVAEHQEYLRKKANVERAAAEIRARLFELIDIPEAPTFGEALELAEWVEQKIGIRPAFLLAIITQESALGRNVGRCHLVNFETGESVHINTGARMRRGMAPGPPHHSTRNDVAHFLNITRELGRNPNQTLISCPMAVGWGGAMGPAQFIPSTWMSRRPRLEPFVQGTPDPWNIRHAFLASALYLRDLGGLNNERTAALRYFAGGNWANPANAFYGNQVVQRINCLQTFIDHGTMTAVCERMIFIPR